MRRRRWCAAPFAGNAASGPATYTHRCCGAAGALGDDAGAAGFGDRCNCARCCWTGAAATTVVALTTATVAATFTAAPPPRSSDLRPARMLPRSAPRTIRRFEAGGCSRPLASARRARKISVSTAACERSSSSEISRYERPCHSRRRIARRWFSGSCSRTSCRPISSSDAPRRRGRQLLDDIEVGRRLDPAAAPRGAAAREADVVGDLEEPRRLELRHDAALDPAERVQERALDGVLGLLPRAELVQAVAEDLVRVLLVEGACEVRLGSAAPFDPRGTTYGRNCGQNPSSPEREVGELRPSTPVVTSWVEAARSGQPILKWYLQGNYRSSRASPGPVHACSGGVVLRRLGDRDDLIRGRREPLPLVEPPGLTVPDECSLPMRSLPRPRRVG